jgi:hypothetical protein
MQVISPIPVVSQASWLQGKTAVNPNSVFQSFLENKEPKTRSDEGK